MLTPNGSNCFVALERLTSSTLTSGACFIAQTQTCDGWDSVAESHRSRCPSLAAYKLEGALPHDPRYLNNELCVQVETTINRSSEEIRISYTYHSSLYITKWSFSRRYATAVSWRLVSSYRITWYCTINHNLRILNLGVRQYLCRITRITDRQDTSPVFLHVDPIGILL